MPFEIREQDGQYCVFTKGEGGKKHGCHPTRKAALKQMAALYVNVPEARHARFDAEFLGPQTIGDIVRRDGLIFEAGDYPDKQYQMTPEELRAVPDRFRAVPLDLEHTPTILSGHLGTLEDVAVSPCGGKLAGTVAIPKWLNDVIGPDPLKVSTTWDRDTKDLTKLALVLNPRVPEAAVMSAYAQFTGGGDKMPDEKPPSWLEGFKAWLRGDAPEERAVSPAVPPPAAAADEGRFTALEKQLAEERSRRFAAEAAAFADRIIPTRAMPAERATIVALHTRAAEDDAKEPATVTFGTGADKTPLTGSRVAAFEAAYMQRPETLMTRDMVPANLPPGAAILSSSQSDQEEEAKKITESVTAWAKRNGVAKEGR